MPSSLGSQRGQPGRASGRTGRKQQRQERGGQGVGQGAGQGGQVGAGPARRQPARRGGSGARRGGAQLAPNPNGLTADLADPLDPWPDVRSSPASPPPRLVTRSQICVPTTIVQTH